MDMHGQAPLTSWGREMGPGLYSWLYITKVNPTRFPLTHWMRKGMKMLMMAYYLLLPTKGHHQGEGDRQQGSAMTWSHAEERLRNSCARQWRITPRKIWSDPSLQRVERCCTFAGPAKMKCTWVTRWPLSLNWSFLVPDLLHDSWSSHFLQ